MSYAFTGDRDGFVAESCLNRLALWRVDDYDAWIEVGMALRGLGYQGLALWDQWSRKSAHSYEPGCCEKAWKYLKPEGITQATLTWLAERDDPKPKKTFESVGIGAVDLNRLMLPGDAMNAIAGYAPTWGAPRPVTDRSAADWIVVKWLVKRGATDDQIAGIFKQYPIGRGKYAERGDEYLSMTIAKARQRFPVMA